MSTASSWQKIGLSAKVKSLGVIDRSMLPWLVGWAVRCALTLPTCAMKSMGESLYQSMDAPMAPLEKKAEAWKPAETCCFKLDLCVQLPSSP